MPQNHMAQQTPSSHSNDVITDMNVEFVHTLSPSNGKAHFLHFKYKSHGGYRPSHNETGFQSKMATDDGIYISVTQSTAQQYRKTLSGTAFAIKNVSVINWQHNFMAAKATDIVPSSSPITILPKHDRNTHKTLTEFENVKITVKLEDNLPKDTNLGTNTKYALDKIFEENVRPSSFQSLDKKSYVRLKASFNGKDINVLLHMPEGLEEHKDPLTRVQCDILSGKETNIASLKQISDHEYIAEGTEPVPLW